MAVTLLLAPDADRAEPCNPGHEDLDQPERTAGKTNPSDLPRPQANSNDDPVPHAAQAMTGPDEDPHGPGLWTRLSDAVGASWRSLVWDSGTDPGSGQRHGPEPSAGRRPSDVGAGRSQSSGSLEQQAIHLRPGRQPAWEFPS